VLFGFGDFDSDLCFLGFGTLMIRRGYVLPDHVGTFDAMRWLRWLPNESVLPDRH